MRRDTADRGEERSDGRPERKPKPTFSATERCGKRAPSCGTRPIRRRSGETWWSRSSRRSLPIWTRPPSGRSIPAKTRSKVDLPQPEAPRMAVKLDSGTEKETDCKAATGRPRAQKVLRTSSIFKKPSLIFDPSWSIAISEEFSLIWRWRSRLLGAKWRDSGGPGRWVGGRHMRTSEDEFGIGGQGWFGPHPSPNPLPSPNPGRRKGAFPRVILGDGSFPAGNPGRRGRCHV